MVKRVEMLADDQGKPDKEVGNEGWRRRDGRYVKGRKVVEGGRGHIMSNRKV
jgi:hypothetical protein